MPYIVLRSCHIDDVRRVFSARWYLTDRPVVRYGRVPEGDTHVVEGTDAHVLAASVGDVGAR